MPIRSRAVIGAALLTACVAATALARPERGSDPIHVVRAALTR